MQRSRVEESLEDNIEDIKQEILTCNKTTRRAELLATVDVERELQKSIILKTSTAAAKKKEHYRIAPIEKRRPRNVGYP